jgi:2-dehydro-3-deoxygalactonokinase
VDRLVSCDWGTSAFRLRLVEVAAEPRVTAERTSERGAAAFRPGDAAQFQNYLALELDRLFEQAETPPVAATIYLSGMVTSTLGWRVLPYATLPFPLDGSAAVTESDRLERSYGTHRLVFISGVRSEDDVLRGEETELIGILSDAAHARFAADGIAILPGTHSKVVELQAGRALGFRTYMTGELYQVLRQASILRHSVDAEAALDQAGGELFDQGVRRAAGGGLLESLFSVRANVLLAGVAPASNSAYLSGLLIGAETASILRRFPAPRPLVLGGGTALQSLYARALELLGAGTRLHAVPRELSAIAAARGHCVLRAALEPEHAGQEGA